MWSEDRNKAVTRMMTMIRLMAVKAGSSEALHPPTLTFPPTAPAPTTCSAPLQSNRVHCNFVFYRNQLKIRSFKNCRAVVSGPLVLGDLCYIWISGAHKHMFYQYNASIKRRTGPAKASWDISKTWLVLTACLSAISPTKLSPNFAKNPGLLLGSSKAFPVKISACIARNCWWRSEYWWGLIGWTCLSLRGLACP